jgi:hypothetical protein
MNDDQAQGLWHDDYFRGKGPVNTSLGQDPRITANKLFSSANGAIHPVELVWL